MTSLRPIQTNSALRRAREGKGWTRESLAAILGTTSISIYRWESGRSIPSLYYQQRLCQAFEQTPDELGLLPPLEEIEDAPLTPIRQFALPPFGLAEENLIGRQQVLQHIKQHLLTTQSPAPLALAGLAGIGKTSIASIIARDQDILDHFVDGILWAGLGPHPQIHAALNLWGLAIQLSQAELAQCKTAETLGKAVQARIGARRFLLILDDVWEFEAALALKVGGPNCAYLLTTRFPHLAHQFAFNNTVIVPELTEHESAELLEHLAPNILDLYPEQALLLSQQTGGLPLTLTLIGRHLHVQMLSQQPRRVQQSLLRLANVQDRLELAEALPPVERPPHLQESVPLSLQNSLRVSIQELQPATLSVLRVLGVFPAKPNTIAEDIIIAVVGNEPIATLSNLDLLLDAGLIESAGDARYMVHQSIVDYMQANAELTALRLTVLDYYVRYMRDNHDNPQALDSELTNILATLEQAKAAARIELLSKGIVGISTHLRYRGLYVEAVQYLTLIYEQLDAITDPTLQIEVVMEFGWALRGFGRFDDATHAFREGVILARQHDNTAALGTCLRMIGLIAISQGKYDEAERSLQEAAALARRHQDLDLLGKTLLGLSSLNSERGDNDQTEQLLIEAVAIGRHLQDDNILGTALSNLGVLAYDHGAYQQAQSYVEEALAFVRQSGNLVLQCYILDNLGGIHFAQSHFDQAMSLIAEGLAIARHIQSHERICSFLTSQAELALAQHEFQQANICLTEGLQLAQQYSYYTLHSKLLQLQGKMFLSLGQWAEATQALNEGIRQEETAGSPRILGVSLCLLGEVHVSQNQSESAEEYFHQALNVAQKSDLRSVEAQALFGLARCALLMDHSEDAARWGKQSLEKYNAIGDGQASAVQEWLTQLASQSSE